MMDWKAVWKREHEEAFRVAKSVPPGDDVSVQHIDP